MSLEVLVVRSTRRRKTAEARVRGSVLEVRLPAGLSDREEAEMISYFRERFERRHQARELDLAQRAARLCQAHDLPEPTSIRWVPNQERRWGSCTPARGTIRLSDRLTTFPEWVIDYVIVHELAHLLEAGHTPRFWSIVNRYPLTERARGFLIAKAWEEPAG